MKNLVFWYLIIKYSCFFFFFKSNGFFRVSLHYDHLLSSSLVRFSLKYLIKLQFILQYAFLLSHDYVLLHSEMIHPLHSNKTGSSDCN